MEMKKYRCNLCGYVYDPDLGDKNNGVAPGTPFENFQRIGAALFVVLRKNISQ